MQSRATTVEQYLAELPVDRREALEAVRSTILKNLPEGYEEGMQYGMIGYFVPHSVYPPGYHCDSTQPLPFAALASQKKHMAVYLMCVYGDREQEAWFRDAWIKTGKKLDMGKCCVRFKKIDDVPLTVIGQAIRRVPANQFIEQYESTVKGSKGKRASKTNRRTSTAGKSSAMKKGRSRTATTKQTASARKTVKKKADR